MSSGLQLDVCRHIQWRRHLVNAYEVKAGMVFFCGLKAVWSMPERFRVVCTMQGAIQVLWFTFTFLLLMQSAVLAMAIPSVRPSVCPSVHPSVTRWFCIQTNEDRIMRSSLWGSMQYSLLTPTTVGERGPLPPKICAQSWPIPLWKNADFDQYLLITSQP